jgi:hypothetical protein
MRVCSARVANVKCEVPDQIGSEGVGAGGTVVLVSWRASQARRGGTCGCRGARVSV